jgi:hypothetical protein
MLEITTYSMDEILPLVPLLEKWFARDYINYPFLWVPSPEELCTDMFIKEKNALVALCRKQQEVVGAAASIVLDSKHVEAYFEHPICEKAKECGFDPSKILYMSFFLTAPAYRNDPMVVSKIYQACQDFGRAQGKTQVCYWRSLGKPDHPLKPQIPVIVEPWEQVICGFKSMNMQMDIPWQTLQPDGSVKMENHAIEFFIKSLA